MTISSEPANYELFSSDSLSQGPLLFLNLQMIQPIGLDASTRGKKKPLFLNHSWLLLYSYIPVSNIITNVSHISCAQDQLLHLKATAAHHAPSETKVEWHLAPCKRLLWIRSKVLTWGGDVQEELGLGMEILARKLE